MIYTMKTYNKQNKIQKEFMRLWSIFRTDWDQVNRAKDCGYEPYNFGATTKEKIGVGLIATSLVVPCTAAPVTVPLLYKTMLGGRK